MDILKSNIVVGVTAALAVTVLAPVLVPVLVTAGRPLAKSLLRGGLMLYEKSREAVATAGESVEDMVAEIRAEEAMRGAAAEPAQASDATGQRPAAPAATPVAGTAPRAPGAEPPPQGAAQTQAPQAGIASV